MFELIFDIAVTVLCVWLFVKAVGLAFKITWGAVKIIAGILLVLAAPALVLSLIFAGGVVLLIPIVMILAAFGLLKSCL